MISLVSARSGLIHGISVPIFRYVVNSLNNWTYGRNSNRSNFIFISISYYSDAMRIRHASLSAGILTYTTIAKHWLAFSRTRNAIFFKHSKQRNIGSVKRFNRKQYQLNDSFLCWEWTGNWLYAKQNGRIKEVIRRR